MIKIQFTNAQVRDNGYGLMVNGRELSEIISTALGTRVKEKYGYSSGLPDFESNCCNVLVLINPHPVTTEIENDEGSWENIKDMEEYLYEQYQEKTTEAES